MSVYITVCSKEKRENECLLPAIKRYISDRINYVYELSQKDNVDFRILSGEFGILKPDDLIPRYNEKLLSSDVDSMVSKARKQLRKSKFSKITFFGRNREDYQPYYDVMRRVCQDLNIDFEIIFL